MTDTRVAVRFTDQDSHKHVHHVAIVDYVAHARVEFIDSLLWKHGIKDRYDYTLARLEVDFLAPIEHPGEVIVQPHLEHIGNKSFVTTYKLFKDGEEFANARCVSVFFDLETGKTVEVPEELR